MKQDIPDAKAFPTESRVFLLNMQTFEDVISYIRECCRKAGCGEKAMNHISVASSEILANIESYAYKNGGEVGIMTSRRENRMVITFKDCGKPFDPLSVKPPDITAPLSERTPGGLGIFIVRKLMSDVSYQYTKGQNVLTIEKEL